MDDPRSQQPSRRWLRWLLAFGGAVVLAIAAAVAFVLVNPSAVAALVKEQAVPKLANQLGRSVDIGPVDVKLFPPRAVIRDIRIGGRPGEPPLAEVSEGRAALRFWPLVRSRGHDVQLKAVSLEHPRVNLVRAPDGTWSYQGLGGNGGGSSQRQVVVVTRLQIRQGELHVIDRATTHPGETVALRHIDVDAWNLGSPSVPATATLSAALASDSPNLKGQLRAQPGVTAVNGSLAIRSLDLSRVRGVLPAGLGALLTAGQASFEVSFGSLADGALHAQGHVNAPHLALRGQPASSSFRFDVQASKSKTKAATVTLTDVRVHGPGVDLGGKASLRTRPMTATFSLSGPLLDLDTLLASLPPSQAKGEDSGGTVPPSMRREISRVTAHGDIEVHRLIAKKLSAENVRVRASLAQGVLTITRADATVYGGALDAANTRIDLTQPVPAWELHGTLSRLDMRQAMQRVSGANPLTGMLDGRIDLRGAGDLWEQLRSTMTGSGDFTLKNGQLTTGSLEQAISQPLVDALGIAGRVSALARGGTGATFSPHTELNDVAGSFRVESGWVRFGRPMTVHTGVGEVSLGGAIGLDQRLDLKGSVKLSPEYVSRVSGFTPAAPIDAPLAIAGSLDSPQVRVDPAALVQAIAQQSPPAESIRKKMEERLHGLFGTPQQ